MEEQGDFTLTHPQHDIKTEQREGAGLENWNDAATSQGMLEC